MFFIQTILPIREQSVFFVLAAGHVGEAVPNARHLLTRKLITSPFKAGLLLFFGNCRHAHRCTESKLMYGIQPSVSIVCDENIVDRSSQQNKERFV